MSEALISITILGCSAMLVGTLVSIAWWGDDGYWWWSEDAKAVRARQARWSAHFREFLSYGFDAKTAREKANARMAADAKKAEEVLDA